MPHSWQGGCQPQCRGRGPSLLRRILAKSGQSPLKAVAEGRDPATLGGQRGAEGPEEAARAKREQILPRLPMVLALPGLVPAQPGHAVSTVFLL